MNELERGQIGWVDLTVENAGELKRFYEHVVGWKARDVDRSGYADYSMQAPGSGRDVAGICHARGANAELPPVWLVYITVPNLDESIARCLEYGGDVVVTTREVAGHGRYCVIRDPAGAHSALFEPAAKNQ